ncbi:hypothetical protein F1I11_22130, partial [Salmonella enterica]|nr:hypothetical protein [Salmonella enterica]
TIKKIKKQHNDFLQKDCLSVKRQKLSFSTTTRILVVNHHFPFHGNSRIWLGSLPDRVLGKIIDSNESCHVSQ